MPGGEPFSKGALFRVLDDGTTAPLVSFQLNPAELHRRQRWDDALGAVRETIHLSLEFHAAAFGSGEEPSRAAVYPRLAALEEALAEGARARRPANDGSRRGRSRSCLVFSWGAREIPVWLDGLHIDETGFDRELQPTRASARLELSVLVAGEARRVPGASERLKAYQARRARAAARAPSTHTT